MRGHSSSLRLALSKPYRPKWKRSLNGAVSYPQLRSSSFGHPFRSASTLPDLPIFRAITSHDPLSTSIVHSVSGRSFTYGSLVSDVLQRRKRLTRLTATSDKQGAQRLEGRPVAFLAENSYDYVVTLLSILAVDAIALPLSPAFPASELDYILNNSQAGVLVTTEKYARKAQEILDSATDNVPVLETTAKLMAGGSVAEDVWLQSIPEPQGGMMLYTSGTTNRPKGVFLPHSALSAQAESLVKAWSYSPKDRLLHLLPLHHIHGILNAILAPLHAASSIEFLFPFSPTGVWDRLASPFLRHEPPSQKKPPVTFLTAVPTIYNRLLSAHPTLPAETQEAARTAISPENLRLNISGSAALATPTKAAWSDLSKGNVLLERYGMTEVGMALSCGLDFADRVDGSVGWPLPSVEARLVDTDTNEVIKLGEEGTDRDGRERVGEIQLRGPTVFKEYWRNPKATAEEFVDDDDDAAADGSKGRWFKTGDVAVRRNVEDTGQSGQDWARGPMYFIQGRKNVDIIKRGGEKISALEVERELLSLPQIREAAVLALPSEQTGHKVAAVVVLDPQYAKTGGRRGKPWSAMDMRRALKSRLASFKIPQVMRIVPGGLLRNAMGKVNKKQLAKQVFSDML